VTTNYWIQSNSQNETNIIIPYTTNPHNYTDVSTENQPLWMSLSLISSKC